MFIKFLIHFIFLKKKIRISKIILEFQDICSFLAPQKLQNCIFGHKPELGELKPLLSLVILTLGLPFSFQYCLNISSLHGRVVQT